MLSVNLVSVKVMHNCTHFVQEIVKRHLVRQSVAKKKLNEIMIVVTPYLGTGFPFLNHSVGLLRALTERMS